MKIKTAIPFPTPVEYIQFEKKDKKLFNEFFGKGQWKVKGEGQFAELIVLNFFGNTYVEAEVGDFIVQEDREFVVYDEDSFDDFYER